jgi:predicted GH43/DUF377 family glycosyl hydrolase
MNNSNARSAVTAARTFCVCLLSLINCTERNSNTQDEWAMIPFLKADSVNPVLTPGTSEFTCPVLSQRVTWDNKDVFNPAAVVRDEKIYLLFRAEDTIGKFAGTSRIGLATSDDGLHFTKSLEPVLYPQNDEMKIYEWEGGIEDPRIVEKDDGTYILTYTAYDGKVARLCIATSKDLTHWTKHGLVLKDQYEDTWSKSGAIVATEKEGRIIATKIVGLYWMYWGDTDLFMATSEDLIHWNPLLENGKLKSVLKPRPGYFDSRLVESGPFALVTDNGIVLIYNGMNLDKGGDPKIKAGAYCMGQALFDKNDPSKMAARLEGNFLMPDRGYEITGQVNQVCFAEGLVHFKGKWFMYYGTADSRIAVAVSE